MSCAIKSAAIWKDRGLAELIEPTARRRCAAVSAQPSSAAQLKAEIAKLMEGRKAVKP